jgi:hypothetical protein
MLATTPQAQDTTANLTPVALPALGLDGFQALFRRVDAALPDAGARLQRAAQVLLTARILEIDTAGTYLVESSTPDLYYRTTTVRCTCPDAMQRRVTCKHSYAILLLLGARADARAAEFGLPPAPLVLGRRPLDVEAPIPYMLTPLADEALAEPEPVPAA